MFFFAFYNRRFIDYSSTIRGTPSVLAFIFDEIYKK
jgi:hypothetical protein